MLEILKGLTPEVLASAFVGLAMLGVVIRNTFIGWKEAQLKLKGGNIAPMSTAVGIVWDRDQMERVLQILEDISASMVAISKSQSIMSDQFQQVTQDRLEDILDRLDRTEKKQQPRSRPRPASRK